MTIQFEKVNHQHLETVLAWLAEPHMQEFWNNSQEHKDDIINFVNGRVTPSNYFNGIFTYWVGIIDNEPFCFLLTGIVTANKDCPELWIKHVSKTGNTYSIDFGIDNKKFLGKGLAAPTLIAFTEFFKMVVDTQTDTFFIDPDVNNPRAKHAYAKAGFEMVGDFKNQKRYWDFDSNQTFLMIKRI